MSLIFVYGTLRRGASHHFHLAEARWVSVGRVRAVLYQVDWYPGCVLDEQQGVVVGDLFEVTPEQLGVLDEYEGDEYRRVRVQVETYDGRVEAWVWEWNREVEACRHISSGDWLHQASGE